MKHIFFILLPLLLSPLVSSAYFTTHQSATKITENTILFTIDYQFGFAKRELYMPIGAVRSERDTTTPYLTYTIQDNATTTAIGQASALVLTKDEDAQIKDNQYYLQPGKSAVFTLVALITLSDEELATQPELSQLVTTLPFTMVREGEIIPGTLNPSELQYYLTPTISLTE